MAAQSKTTEQYSTLEWIRDDVTINAPELDHAIAAPELDSAVLAPQAIFHTGPEVAYDESPPEALDRSENDNENQTSSTVLKARRLSKRIVIMTLVCIAIAAAAIGVGIYFGRRAEAHTSSSSSSGSNATFPPSNAPLAKHGILNDSSLAALSLLNGDRRLFYQEHNGQIKQAAYSSSSREWPSTLISVVASDARNNTPLAAITLADDADLLNLEIYLFYVSTNGSLAVALFHLGAWKRLGDKCETSQFVAGTDSRSLSATQITGPDSTRIILIYQNSDGRMMIMEGISFSGLDSSCSWRDLTSKLHSSIPSIRPRSRFSSLYDSGFYLAILFYDNESTTPMFVAYSNGSFFDYTSVISDIPSPIPSSDMVLVSAQPIEEFSPGIISINGTRLVCLDSQNFSLPDSPASSFSSYRLAAASGNSSFYVYHQINDDTFGEEQWDVSIGGWIPSNFTVSTS